MGHRRFHLGRTLRHAGRYRHIVMVLLKYGFADVVHRLPRALHIGSRRAEADDSTHSRPARARMALQEMGPIFIKLGQLISTRPDMAPQEYVAEFANLQDHVAPVDFERVRSCVERELGAPLGDLFAEVETEPLAAGSIAQVHRVTLHDGRRAVLKVRRPDIARTLAVECEILESLADWIGSVRYDSSTLDVPAMVREFTEAVVLEADMSVERRNLKRFAANFADDPHVHVPACIEEYCTESILAMEYIEGVKPTDRAAVLAAGLDPRLLASRGADFVLRQIFDFGLFHSDPHPGNILLMKDDIVAQLDFGQVARLGDDDRELLAEIVLAIVDRDEKLIVRACGKAELIGEETDLDALEADARDLVETYYDLPLGGIPLREVITEIFRLIRRHGIRPPSQFTLMLKSLMTIESLALTLDSDFNIIDSLRPYARRFRLRQLDPRRHLEKFQQAAGDAVAMAAALPDDARTIIRKLKKGDFQLRVHHEHLVELSTTLDKSSNRISFAVIIAALLVASSLLAPQSGAVLGVVSLQALGVAGYCIAAVMGLWLLISILKSRSM